MEPRIQYAKTSDGVSIAYATAGHGPALLVVPSFPLSDVQARWKASAHLYQPLAERFGLVWYDFRATGLSDREVNDYSLEAMVRDVEAVVEAAGLARFAMFGAYAGAPIAATYAATHSDKVSSLVLVDGLMRSADHAKNPIFAAERALRHGDWTVYTETLARVLFGFENQELSAKAAMYLRECVGADALRALFSSLEAWDVTTLLQQISARSLVAHNRSNRLWTVQTGQRLAARIPNARFLVIDDMDYHQLPGTIIEFLGESDQIEQRRLDSVPQGTAVILFADIVDSTGLTERLGDTAFREKARGLDEAMRAVIRENGGAAVEGKTLGDGVLAVFTSAKQAIACARACHEAAGVAGLSLHAGIHAGDVIREADNVYGGAVNIAARIAAASAAGETLVSETVRSLARTSAGVRFEDRGEQALKGVDDPIRVWAVREGGV